ncbi:MAG TPA: class I SAM-dependent methyltransferase [Candidatus Angelobacter sp.]|nr:class I SAM-dependent methyltransferase [Candidatus Angelobacter sp.]
MSSPSSGFMRWFRGSEPAEGKAEKAGQESPRTKRRSIGLGEFMRGLKGSGEEKPCVLDLGSTSPTNINFLIEQGMRVCSEDVLRACKDLEYLVKQEDGTESFNVEKFFAENLNYQDNQFDAILCWDATDYLPEPLVKPLVDRLYRFLKPHGTLLAFFHDKDAGPETPYCRYHIVQTDTLELEARPSFRLQRIFNNRHVENLFKDFASRKFFLGRDNFREVIIVR